MIELFAVLFVYRALILLHEDDGPFEVFERIRCRIDSLADTNQLKMMYSCPYCLSVWLSALPSAYLSTDIWQFFIYLLGVSGGAIILKLMVK